MAVACAAALLSCSVAFADTTDTPTPSSSTSSTAPAVQPRKPADTGSAIQTPVDQQTEAFRKALAEKQARLDAFNAQLDALDKDLEIASQQYYAAADALEATKSKVSVAQSDLDTARQAYGVQASILGQRASSMYKDGSFGAFEVLLSSKSVSDFIARVKFLNTVGLADADIAASLKAQKDVMEKQMVELKNSQSQAEALEFEMKARQIEIMLRIQERQQMYADAQTDLLSMLDKEAARRKTEESALLAEVLSGATAKGIVVEPGSPVETALAYHGVPYLWGGAIPAAFDCSGLVLCVFAQHGVPLPHYSGSQFLMGQKVSPADLQPNDVVFFGSPVHHVGIYIGGGYFIHAPRTGDFVKISKLADRSDFAGARRYPWQYRVGPPAGGKTTTSKALSSVR